MSASQPFPEKGLLRAGRNDRWWMAPPKGESDPNGVEVSRWLSDVATRIETAQTERRWRSLVFYRHFTGRPSHGQFAYGMARRPVEFYGHYGQWEFRPPSYNLIATCADIYINRLLRQQIYLSVVPERGDFSQRQLSKMIEMWLDGGMTEIGFWQQFTKMGIDGLCYGSGILKVGETLDGKCGIFRVHPDELLYTNPDDDNPNTVIQRVWANREDIYDRYGTTPEARKAIENAPSAFPCFYFGGGTLDCRDVIPLLGGWRLPHVPQMGSKAKERRPGRYVLAINGYAIEDEPYEDPELPFERWDFHQLPSGIFGQGLSEILLSINEEIDRSLGAVTENIQRCGWPKWLVEANSGVNEAALGDSSGAVVKFSGPVRPEQVAPPTTNPEVYAQLERLIRLGKERAHISEQAIKGQSALGAGASAVALEKETQIDDANFAEMGQRLEQFVIGCGYKLIRLATRLKPSFKLAGRTSQLIKWNEIDIVGKKPIGLTAFGMSRLPQSISGRQQILDSMLANGTISKQLHTRFSQVPDVDGLMDRLNARQESVDRVLDELFVTGEYDPPTAFMDLDYAKDASEVRYLLEQNQETPQEILDLYLQWHAAVLELIEQRDTPDVVPGPAQAGVAPAGATAPGPTTAPPAPGPPGGFGGQPDNPALAPSPPQIAPVMGRPALPAAA